MARINLDVTEFGFNSKNTAQYALTVLLGFDSVYYNIVDEANQVLVLRSFHFDHNKKFSIDKALDSTLADDSYLKKIFRTKRIIVDTVHYTCVPTKFFDASQKQLYFKNINDIVPQENIFLSEDIANTDAVLVYPIERVLYNKINEAFPSAKILNSITTQAGFLLSQKKLLIGPNSTDRTVCINFRDGYLQIFFFEGNQFVFSNNFKFSAPQDVIYYTLLIYKQFKLNPSTVPLHISGTITEDSDIYKFIYRYIRNVYFLPKPDALKLGNQFTGVPAFFYNDIFCGTLY